MSVQGPTISSNPSTSPSTPSLHVRTDPYSGRKYHASSTLAENADLLGICPPFSYTIWKRFRNEVCAECWRYDGGRRSFLTRRDDQGLPEDLSLALDGTQYPPKKGDRSAGAPGSVGAGLWFCNATCQRNWVAREGIHTVDLLRRLERGRQKKTKSQPNPATDDEEREITHETANRAWGAVRAAEKSLKEVRRWQNILLDDYETDMARYVLLALLRCHRERCNQYDSDTPQSSPRHAHSPSSDRAAEDPRTCRGGEEGQGRRSEWRTFASLQSNELSLLRACPEILEHQIRVYQALRGLFGRSGVPAYPANVSSSSSQTNSPASAPDEGAHSRREDRPAGGDAARPRRPELADVITIANVRLVLGVDPGNSFGIWEVPLMDESECLGFAVYPIASFFNHHCSPNVRKAREGRKLRFLTECAVEEGKELCISYGHVGGMEWSTRQKELLEGWYFNCRCGRCESEEGEGTQTS